MYLHRLEQVAHHSEISVLARMVSRGRAAYLAGMNNRLRFLSRFCFLLFVLLVSALSGWAQALPPDTLLNETFRTNEWD